MIENTGNTSELKGIKRKKEKDKGCSFTPRLLNAITLKKNMGIKMPLKGINRFSFLFFRILIVSF